jgi:hypothetical protein
MEKCKISAIFKKGNKSQAKNYRPVSLTSVVCKLMEKLIRLYIINHMKANKLFSNKIDSLNSNSNLGCRLSGPGDLSVFKFWRSVKTIFLLITRSFSSY